MLAQQLPQNFMGAPPGCPATLRQLEAGGMPPAFSRSRLLPRSNRITLIRAGCCTYRCADSKLGPQLLHHGPERIASRAFLIPPSSRQRDRWPAGTGRPDTANEQGLQRRGECCTGGTAGVAGYRMDLRVAAPAEHSQFLLRQHGRIFPHRPPDALARTSWMVA